MQLESGYFNNLKNKYADRKVAVGVFGLSKEGLKFAVRQAESGFKVSCFDFRDYRLDMVRRGISFTKDISDNKLFGLVRRGLVSACGDFRQISKLDLLTICIPEEESTKAGCYNITDISKIIGHNMNNGLLIGFSDIEKSEALKQQIESVLDSLGLRYAEDYLFGSIIKRG